MSKAHTSLLLSTIGGLALTACSASGTAPTFDLPPVAATSALSSTSPSPSTSAAPGPQAPHFQSYTFRTGPFHLSASSKNALAADPIHFTFHVDAPLWVTTFEPQLEDASGNPVPSELLRIAVLSNQHDANPLCSGERTPMPFAAATGTMQKIEMPEGFGYAVLAEDPLEATISVQNTTAADYPQVYFRFTVRGEPMNNRKAIHDVVPLLLESDPCHHEAIAVEPGKFLKTSSRFTTAESGHVIAAYGLLQDYGVGISLAKEGEPSPFWQASSVMDNAHHVVGLPQYKDPKGAVMQSGDGLLLSTSYQNDSTHWLDHATAAAMIYLAPGQAVSSNASSTKPYKAKSASESATQVQQTLF